MENGLRHRASAVRVQPPAHTIRAASAQWALFGARQQAGAWSQFQRGGEFPGARVCGDPHGRGVPKPYTSTSGDTGPMQKWLPNVPSGPRCPVIGEESTAEPLPGTALRQRGLLHPGSCPTLRVDLIP